VKKLLSHSIDFILFSNFWVAFCVAGLMLGVAHFYCIDDCWLYAVFAFSGTFATYNFHRLVRNHTFQKEAIITERNRWQNRFRPFLLVACAIAIGTAATIFFFLPIKPLSIVLLGVAGLIVLFYAIPLPFAKRTLRDISGLKNIWIVFVWIILVSIPLINRGKTIQFSDLFLIAALCYIQIIPFDLRDVSYDSRSMKTLPQLLGNRFTVLFGTLLTLGWAFAMFLNYSFNWFLPVTLLVSLAGLWWPQSERTNRQLELVWDGALLTLGFFYYFLPCIHS